MLKQSMDDRNPEYVVPNNLLHPNKWAGITRERFDFSCFNVGRDGMSEEERKVIMDMIWNHRNMFIYSKKELGAVDRSKLPKVEIKTKGETAIKSHPYRRSPKDRKIIEDLVEEMLEAGTNSSLNLALLIPCRCGQQKGWRTTNVCGLSQIKRGYNQG